MFRSYEDKVAQAQELEKRNQELQRQLKTLQVEQISFYIDIWKGGNFNYAFNQIYTLLVDNSCVSSRGEYAPDEVLNSMFLPLMKRLSWGA